MQENMKMTQIKWFMVLALFAFAIGICNTIKENKGDKKYFDELNLKLTGIVESVDLSYIPNGFGVAKVSIINSNRHYYDPRDDHEYYYCLIKNGKAEIYQSGLYECAIGDTINVNTRKRIFLIKNGVKEDIEDIVLSTYDKFYNYVRKNHQKF
jgi:hypothetical protein